MKKLLVICSIFLLTVTINAQDYDEYFDQGTSTAYELAPRWLVDVPTAGTLPRAHWQIGFRFYPDGGTIGFTDIGLSNRFMLGISYGADKIISNSNADWNPRIEFNLKFRLIDDIEYLPAFAFGFSSQGFGSWNADNDRFTFKSRGFYGVLSRSFYFYQWTAGWHGGLNYSLENDVDTDKAVNVFLGVDATFNYNLALLFEYDAGLNDDKSGFYSGKGRGYLNMSVKWIFTEKLELEALLKDLLLNRGTPSFTREIRLTYIDSF